MSPRDTGLPSAARTHDYRGAFGADGTRVVRKREIPEVPAERGTVVEDPGSGFCGAVVRVDIREVTLEDRHGLAVEDTEADADAIGIDAVDRAIGITRHLAIGREILCDPVE